MPFDEEDLDPHGECRAKIERLTAALRTSDNTARLNLKVAQDRGTEIERLRADLATHVAATEATENRIIDAEFAAQELRSEIERLTAENDKLRNFLSIAVDAHDDDYGAVIVTPGQNGQHWTVHAKRLLYPADEQQTQEVKP